jgi:hypothetical protein
VKRLYITFSGAAYDATTAKIVANAPRFGADEVLVYDDLWLTGTEFYRHNRWLWEHPGHNGRKLGFGWFAWKPFIILDALDRCADGDVVLFSDADTHPISNFSVLYSQCAQDGGAMFFNAYGCDNRYYTKRDCYVVMGQDHPPYTDHQTAGVARFMLFQKGPWKPRQFLYEWLTYCVNPKATTFDASTIAPELEGFGEHRTEQAIMTLLAYKYGYKLYREACQFGAAHPEDKELYGQLFEQVGGTGARILAGSRFRSV